jgi:hypothetical protein
MEKRTILYILSVIFPDWQRVQIILIFNDSVCVLWKERIVRVINSTNMEKKLSSQWVTANFAISRRVCMSLLSDTLSWFWATESLISLLNNSLPIRKDYWQYIKYCTLFHLLQNDNDLEDKVKKLAIFIDDTDTLKKRLKIYGKKT